MPLKVAVVFIAVAAVWLSVFATLGNRIATIYLPELRWEFEHIAPQYRLIEMHVIRQHGEAVFKADMLTRQPLHIGRRVIPPGVSLECSTLVGHLSQPLVLLLSTVVTAGLLRRIRPLPALPLTIIAASVIVAIDVPFILVGALEDLVLSITSPGDHSPWVIWMNFLNGGGRLALGIAAGLLVIAAAVRSGVTADSRRPRSASFFRSAPPHDPRTP